MAMIESAQANGVRTTFANPAIRSLIGACIGMTLGASPVLLLSFGVYLLPIVKDTGWDRALIAGSIGPPMIIAGLMSPVIGLLTNRFGPRAVITCGFPLCGLTLVLLSTAPTAAAFALIMILGGVLISAQTMIPFVTCVSGWFQERRGLALGVTLACTGVGLILIPPIAAFLIERIGWRHTFLTFGLAVALIGIPVARLLITNPPAAAAVDRSKVPGLTWRQVLRLPSFWFLTLSITLIGGAVSAGTVNLHVLLTERGVSAERASFVMGLVGISMILARLLFGYLFDRVRPKFLTTFICLVVGSAFVVLASTSGSLGVVVAATLIGIGFGAEGDALSYMSSRLFGMRDFATIFGMMFFAFTLGGGLGPITFAWFKAHDGNYQNALHLAAAACGIAALLIVLIRDTDLDRVDADRRAIDGLVPAE